MPSEVYQLRFMQKLNPLQEWRTTWYTSAAWSVHITYYSGGLESG